jgi:hypothetical protein
MMKIPMTLIQKNDSHPAWFLLLHQIIGTHLGFGYWELTYLHVEVILL